MLCNPASPVAAPGYFETTIVGMKSYCNGFAKVGDAVSSVDAYEKNTNLPGVSARNSSTIVFRLLQPTSDFLNILGLGFDSARPNEYMKYLPDSAALRQHTLSDGPYRITSYSPGKGFTLERNPVWEQATDTLRHAYVDKVVINEDLTAESTQEQLEAGVGDLDWNVQPPTQDLPGLEGSPNLVIGPPSGYLASRLLALNEYAGPLARDWYGRRSSSRLTKTQSCRSTAGQRSPQWQLSPSCPPARAIFPGSTRTRTTTVSATQPRPGRS